jgi:hypothetical protein
MSRAQRLDFETAALSDRIRKKMAKVTEMSNLGKRISEIADYKEEFDRAFDGYINQDLPKDELFYKIQAEMIAQADQAKAKKEKNQNPLGNSRVLPEVMDPVDKLRRKLA